MSRQRAPRSARPESWAVTALAISLVSAGCLDNPGSDPPPAELNFPIAMTLGGGGDQLFVANSNFDLGFNSGTLQAYDVRALDGCIEECRFDESPTCVITPSQLEARNTQDLVLRQHSCPGLLTSEVLIGSFASDLAAGPDEDRLYLTIRSESNLTFVDVVQDEGRALLSCGGEPGERHECAPSFRQADQTVASERDLELPLDPVALHVGRLSDLGGTAGDYLMAAQRGGQATLFVDRDGVPTLVDVLEGLPSNLENLIWEKRTDLAWMPSSRERSLARLGVAADPDDPLDSFLFDAGPMFLSGIDTGDPEIADMRDVAFDPADPERAYILSRRPEALFVVDLASTSTTLEVDEIVEVCVGPSRLQVERMAGRTVAFVSCFDNDTLYVVDASRGQLLGVTSGLSGPFVMETDLGRDRLYVTDFSSSIIRIFSLDPVRRCLEGDEEALECSPRTVAVLGIPRAVGGLQ